MNESTPLPAALQSTDHGDAPLTQSVKGYNRIKPALGRIVLEELPFDEKSEGGIYMPKLKEQSGNVCRVRWVCDPYWAAGDDQDHHAPEGPMYKVGQLVLVGKYNGVDIQLGRNKYISMNESDIIGTLEQGE